MKIKKTTKKYHAIFSKKKKTRTNIVQNKKNLYSVQRNPVTIYLRLVLDRDNRSWFGITFITSVNFGICFSTIWVPFSCAIFPKPLSKGTWKIGTVCFNVGWQWVVSEILSFSYMQDRIRRRYRRSLITWCFWWIQCLFKICGDLYTYWNQNI